MTLDRISVVTPTLRRPKEVAELVSNLGRQSLAPMELVLVDGAPAEERDTERVFAELRDGQPFDCRYYRSAKGTAIQRNAGIEAARGDLIALVDDDVRLEPRFLEAIAGVLRSAAGVGGVVGYRTNRYFAAESTERWRWFRRLKLLTVFEPGHYDFRSGYPINANMQPPFSGVRPVQFMTTACAVWRREVFDSGLRFDPFFAGYGVLEDAHFSLHAGKRWQLLQCGDAHCEELSAAGGREDRRLIGYKCVVNYYYVFRDVAGPLSRRQQMRFWRFQAFELLRILASAVRRRRFGDLEELGGRLSGIWATATGKAFDERAAGGANP